jgi:hypothetical protein
MPKKQVVKKDFKVVWESPDGSTGMGHFKAATADDAKAAVQKLKPDAKIVDVEESE